MLFARRRSRIRLILVAPVIVFSTQASARRAYRVQLLASYGESSGKLTIAQRLAEAKGRALPPGFPPAPRSFGAPAVPLSVQTSQVAAEANYGLKAATGVTLFPRRAVRRPCSRRQVGTRCARLRGRAGSESLRWRHGSRLASFRTSGDRHG